MIHVLIKTQKMEMKYTAWKKLLIIGIGLFFFIILIPIILNFVVILPSPIPEKYIIGSPKDWLSFWAVYIGSIGSLIMAGVAFVTIMQNRRMVVQNKKIIAQNKKQLNEIVRQWEEEHRPRINISIAIYRKALFIKIKNIGVGNATDIKMSFNKDFIEKLPKAKYKEMYENVEKRPFSIESGGAKYILIGFCEDIQKEWENKNIILNIKGTYCSKYTINEIFDMEDFITQRFMEVKDALWEIADGLSCPNSNHYPIQQSLDIIAKHTS